MKASVLFTLRPYLQQSRTTYIDSKILNRCPFTTMYRRYLKVNNIFSLKSTGSRSKKTGLLTIAVTL